MTRLADPLRVLVVDDDPAILRTLLLSLKSLGCTTQGASDASQALHALRMGMPALHNAGMDKEMSDSATDMTQQDGARLQPSIDMLLTDMRMGELSGVDLVREVLALVPECVCVVMTAFASYESAVSAIKAGAFDYLPKPFSTDQLEHLLSKVSTMVALRRENQQLRHSLAEGEILDWFHGLSAPASLALQSLVERVAHSEATILLTGETGSGKTALARAIHRRSARAAGPFVEVMCTTLTEQLFESEVFGHARGAFTGAVREHKGKFEMAQGGTLFLDEIGELSSSAQAKLLRFLEDRVIERVGDTKPLLLDVRIIAATNRNLADMVREKVFREDLYYRLNMFECRVPPLRERLADIEPLAMRLFRAAAGRYLQSGQKDTLLPSVVLQALVRYSWPGNVRELRNVVERMALLAVGREPALHDLPPALEKSCTVDLGSRQDAAMPLMSSNALAVNNERLLTLRELEELQIRLVLDRDISMEKAAELLGTNTVTLWRKRKEYGLL